MLTEHLLYSSSPTSAETHRGQSKHVLCSHRADFNGQILKLPWASCAAQSEGKFTKLHSGPGVLLPMSESQRAGPSGGLSECLFRERGSQPRDLLERILPCSPVHLLALTPPSSITHGSAHSSAACSMNKPFCSKASASTKTPEGSDSHLFPRFTF